MPATDLGRKLASSLASDVVLFLFWMVREGMGHYHEQARCVWAVFTTSARRVSHVKKPASLWDAGKQKHQAATSCRASATSMESPSWLSTSNPDSGTSPDVL